MITPRRFTGKYRGLGLRGGTVGTAEHSPNARRILRCRRRSVYSAAEHARLWRCSLSLPSVVRTRDIVRVEEIRAIAANTAYEVVVRLRPEFLGRRPTEYNDFEPPRSQRSALESAERTGDRYPTVFLNGTEQGGPASLRTTPASAIIEICFYPATRVPPIYGVNHPRGVIDVRTRR